MEDKWKEALMRECRQEWEERESAECCNCHHVGPDLEEIPVNFFTGLGEHYYLCAKCADAYGPAMTAMCEFGVSRKQLEEMMGGE